MCGIMGYAGGSPASGIIIEGLARQEYRGYDSAGIALRSDGKIISAKIVGRVSELADKVRELPSKCLESASGIGHTRWATHGGVTETNAHPHESADEMVVLVHNGIIENSTEIKDELESGGIIFSTQTDTEAACQLLAVLYGQCGGDALEAMHRLTERLTGAFALVIMFRDRPGEIWCARRGSPLVTAWDGSASYCASDPTALLSYTHDLCFLEEDEMARLSPDGLKFYGFDGNARGKKSIRLNWDSVMADKGHYEHFMRKEMGEQPDVLRLTVDAHTIVTNVALEKSISLPKGLMKKIRRVQFVACGTSYYATLVARDIMESLDGDIEIRVETASEYRYRNVRGGGDTLAVFVSQSGETADTLAAARIARAKGTHCIAITNVRGSTIDREVEHTILSLAGPEIGVAATKTFMGQISLLALLVMHLLKERGTLSASDEARLISGLRSMPALQQSVLEKEREIKALADKYCGSKGFFFIGRRECVPLTMEGALKMKEIAYLPSEAYAAGEMKHGPIAMLDEQLTVVALVPDTDLREKTLSNVAECRARKAPTLMLASDGDDGARACADDIIFIPRTEPELFPFIGVIPLQLLAYHTAKALGRDIDMPRNLAKSVTVE
ncbi:MAG: glutamine--fructose-6-phosphate transaminase (isomerizing) [Synergistaceae bacterium]|jgi:glucosamine--fructose-6-phosphate aminotransferase (isomerizing)|nr:glutamine--fructose-6-phosphate transaminase (isomerizing) [Synergistaceae bacterium]